MRTTNAITSFIFCFCFVLVVSAREYRVQSPNGLLSVQVQVDKNISWSAFYKSKPVLEKCPVSLTLISGQVLGDNPKLRKNETKAIRQQLIPEVPRRKAVIEDYCNELTLNMKGGYSISFRAYDYGMAYRFGTEFPATIEIGSEQMELNFAGNARCWFPEENSMLSHNERNYLKENIQQINASRFCSLPVLFQDAAGINVLFSEADLCDYPCMFLAGSGTNTLKATFPKRVLDISIPDKGGDRDEIIAKEAAGIAVTKGTRSYPWRLFYITDQVADLMEHDLVFQLSRPSVLEASAWIKPGKVAWDWWNANNIYGVDFKAGINTATYKYYIDFAAKYGLEYIVLDEGWSKTTTNVLESNPEIDIPELVRYGKEKRVDIILWMLWKPLDKDLGAILDQCRNWGIRGIKVDFMQRSDQYMVNYYERVAKEAARRQLLVDFHGAFKPSGLFRTYPNVISNEGVKGLENSKWSKDITPEHNVTLPFTRMVAGPMDYTPGAMDNAQPKDFFPRFDRPMSMGTRCHQLAMYVVYESPLQMLADCPSNYYREKECTEFIAGIPTTWDDTKLLTGKVGEYIAIARKKGNTWYIGAMTNGLGREMELNLSFLSEGSHKAIMMQDGINAAMNAIDYKKVNTTVNSNSKLQVKLAPGGGWAAIIAN